MRTKGALSQARSGQRSTSARGEWTAPRPRPAERGETFRSPRVDLPHSCCTGTQIDSENQIWLWAAHKPCWNTTRAPHAPGQARAHCVPHFLRDADISYSTPNAVPMYPNMLDVVEYDTFRTHSLMVEK